MASTLIIIAILFSSMMDLISTTNGSLYQPIKIFDNKDLHNHGKLQSLNRRNLLSCVDPNPYLSVSVDIAGPLSDRQNVTVTVNGVIIPSELDWIAVMSPSTSDMSACVQDEGLYAETGDFASLPLLCHYPIKFQFLKADPAYLKCSRRACSKRILGVCVARSCSGSLTFDIINIRTDIKFVFLSGGFHAPCVLAYSDPISFANPNQPLYGHLSISDFSATTMKLTWVSGKSEPQTVRFADGKSVPSTVSTFNRGDMCGNGGLFPVAPFPAIEEDQTEFGETAHPCYQNDMLNFKGNMLTNEPYCAKVRTEMGLPVITINDHLSFPAELSIDGIPSPASDLGWHDPGFIHSAILTELSPWTSISYKYGSDLVGWSSMQRLKTPPSSGSSQVIFIAFGDMGKAPYDNSNGHYIQPGSLGVSRAISRDIVSGNVDLVLHIGDISYATGFLAEWDQFLDIITPIASKIPYMTAIGNHERDFPDSGSYYSSPDSGGECGVPYEHYFQMPTQGKDMPWYSFESGPVHFTIMSTEHNWTIDSMQYKWIQHDLASVDRKRTPWLVFVGHRPQYSSISENPVVSSLFPPVDPAFSAAVEPLLLEAQVDLVLWGHVHNYERTCAVYQGRCLQLPCKDVNNVDIYNSSSYQAPVHVIVGMGGFTLDNFKEAHQNWSISRISDYGYVKVNASEHILQFQFITANESSIQDSFMILKN